MNVRKSTIDSYISHISAIFTILLFPGFAFYNTLVAYGLIPPIFGGFFGLFSIIYLTLMLPLVLRLELFKRIKLRKYFFLVVYFYIYIYLHSVISYLVSPTEEVREGFVQFNQTILFMLVVFLLGFFINLNERIYKAFSCFIIVSALLLLAYYIITGQLIFYAKSFSDESVQDYVSTYQEFARSALISSLIVLSMTKTFIRYIIFYTTSIFILLILGARSEFVSFVFSGFLLLFLKFKMSSIRVSQITFFLILASVFIYSNYEKLSNSRSFKIFNISSDASWNARQNLVDIGFNQILDHKILGYFSGHIIEGGSSGSYIHNILSVWAGFGILPFILYILLCFIPFIHCILLSIKYKIHSDKFYFCLGLSIAVIILLLFSKSFYWFLPAMVFGIYLSLENESGNHSKK